MNPRGLFCVITAMVALVGFPAASLSGGKAMLSDEEKAEGFVLLIDGETANGWRGYKSDKFPAKGWEIVDGALHKIAKAGGGDIITEEQFENFDFRFEWKVAPGANSGVFFRISEIGERTYDTAIEYQILDNDLHRDGRKEITSAASNYALYPPTEKAVKPVGEYNEGRIVAHGKHVEHWLNGKKVVEYVIDSDDWNERIANSKFKDWDHFGKMSKGHIGLQDHGDDVWYRNLRIKKLP